MKMWILILLLFECCKENYSKKMKAVPLETSKLLGSWEMTHQEVNYYLISFEPDSSCTFYSYGDTLFSYKFWIKDNTIYLKDWRNVIQKGEILYLNSDTLIFSRLLEKGYLVYIKK